MRSKYLNQPTHYTSPLNGPRRYASKKEAERARQLDLLRADGQVLWWLPQIAFVVGLDDNGKPVRYYADFQVMWRDRGLVHEDVKGGYRGADTNRAKRAAIRDRYGIEIEIV